MGGGRMIIFLAGLQGVPQEFYEAAEIDGAGPLQQVPSHHPADDLAHHLFQPGAGHHRRPAGL